MACILNISPQLWKAAPGCFVVTSVSWTAGCWEKITVWSVASQTGPQLRHTRSRPCHYAWSKTDHFIFFFFFTVTWTRNDSWLITVQVSWQKLSNRLEVSYQKFLEWSQAEHAVSASRYQSGLGYSQLHMVNRFVFTHLPPLIPAL